MNIKEIVMQRFFGAIGAGLVGSMLFFMANLFFGGNGESAYTASFYGFWVFAVVAFFGQ